MVRSFPTGVSSVLSSWRTYWKRSISSVLSIQKLSGASRASSFSMMAICTERGSWVPACELQIEELPLGHPGHLARLPVELRHHLVAGAARLKGKGLDLAGVDPEAARLAQRMGEGQPENAVGRVGRGVEIQLRRGLAQLQSRGAGGDSVPRDRIGRHERDGLRRAVVAAARASPRPAPHVLPRLPGRTAAARPTRARCHAFSRRSTVIQPRSGEILHHRRLERLAVEPRPTIAPREPAVREPADHPRINDVLGGLNAR